MPCEGFRGSASTGGAEDMHRLCQVRIHRVFAKRQLSSDLLQPKTCQVKPEYFTVTLGEERDVAIVHGARLTRVRPWRKAWRQ